MYNIYALIRQINIVSVLSRQLIRIINKFFKLRINCIIDILRIHFNSFKTCKQLQL